MVQSVPAERGGSGIDMQGGRGREGRTKEKRDEALARRSKDASVLEQWPPTITSEVESVLAEVVPSEMCDRGDLL